MQLFLDAMDREVDDLHKNKVRLRFIGDRHALSVKLQARMAASEELTAANPGLKLQVAVSYGGRWDIVQAARRLAAAGRERRAAARRHRRRAFRARTRSSATCPIRICSSAPAAIIASAISCCGISRTPSCTSATTLWPDFDVAAFEAALAAFAGRERRFGLTREQAQRGARSVLKERVLTAIVLVAVLLGVMLGLPPIATVWLLTVLVLVGAWEWAGFIGKGSRADARGVHGGRRAGAGRLPVFAIPRRRTSCASSMTVAVAWWFVAFLWLCLAPARVHAGHGRAGGTAVAGALLAGAGVRHVHDAEHALGAVHARAGVGRRHRRVLRRAVVRPRAAGAARVAQEDLGRRARRRRRERRWSPGSPPNWLFAVDVWPFVMTCVAVAALSIVGDLTESMLKRAAGLKDSGTLFPGSRRHAGSHRQRDRRGAGAGVRAASA